MEKNIKLKTLKILSGKIKIITGLHIGAGNDTLEIGGMDNPILKNPTTNDPYIPGSSIKGKMRSLMEWVEGKVLVYKGEVCSCGNVDCKICRVFGSSATNPEKVLDRGPTRLIVRDAHLNDMVKEKYINENIPFIEEKHENTINRITAVPNQRSIERVVPGTLFDFNLSYRVIDMGDGGEMDEKYFKEVVLKSMAMLEKDYLGGGGSRGNGQIKFIDLVDENNNKIDISDYL